MTETDYLTILDWLARNTVAGKRRSKPIDAPALFDRLGIDSDRTSNSEERNTNRH